MRKFGYICWGIWFLAGIVLKILGLCSWWFATSAIWFPLALAVSAMSIIFITADIVAYIKKRREARIPDECANCLFGKTTDLINKTRKEGEEKALCIGEKILHAKRGEVCAYYQREQ